MSQAGGHDVEVADLSGNSAGAMFTVTPSLILNPSHGPVGTTATVIANGFGADGTIAMSFEGVGAVMASSTHSSLR